MTPRPMPSRPVAVLAAALVAVSLGACGEGERAGPAPTTDRVVPAPTAPASASASESASASTSASASASTSASPSGSGPATTGAPRAAEPDPQIWKGFRFDDVMDHHEKYKDGKVLVSRRLVEVLPTLCGQRVPALPAGSPQLQLVYEYPESGTRRGVAATASAGAAQRLMRNLRQAVKNCPRDRPGTVQRPEVTWRARGEKLGNEALALSSLTTRSIGGPAATPYYSTEDVLVVRVGRLLWFGRDLGITIERKHFGQRIDSLRRGFASVRDQLRARAD